MTTPDNQSQWPLRPVVTGAIGLVAGLIVNLLLTGTNAAGVQVDPTSLWIAGANAVIAAGGLFVLTAERRTVATSAVLAGVGGLATGLLVWADPSAVESWRLLCWYLGLGLAAVLFQAARDAGRLQFAYAPVYRYAWCGVLMTLAGLAFAALIFALVYLLVSLFELVSIASIRTTFDNSLLVTMLAGGGFGAGVGLMREHGQILDMLKRLMGVAVSVIAPVFAIGLVVFLAMLPFTGLETFWQATRSATPILLTCVLGAVVAINAIIGEEANRDRPIFAVSALVLSWVMLPLAVLAAIATAMRIGQYGFTPDRLAAATLVVGACGAGAVYLLATPRQRGLPDWSSALRRLTPALVLGAAGVSFFLAVPFNGFNEISTRDQVARLTSGAISAAKFDWPALAFDLGKPGREAVAALAESGRDDVRFRAMRAKTAGSRYVLAQADEMKEVLAPRVLPKDVLLPRDLSLFIADLYSTCRTKLCTVLYTPEATEAIIIGHACVARSGAADQAAVRGCFAARVVFDGRHWTMRPAAAPLEDDVREALARGLANGDVEVRDVQRRQVFVGGRPLGDAFE